MMEFINGQMTPVMFAFRVPTGLDWPRFYIRFLMAPDWDVGPYPYYWGA